MLPCSTPFTYILQLCPETVATTWYSAPNSNGKAGKLTFPTTTDIPFVTADKRISNPVTALDTEL